MEFGKRYLLVGSCAFIFFLLLAFPAGRVHSLLQKYEDVWPQEIKLAGLTGPWHSGSAEVGSILRLPVRQVQWRLTPALFMPLSATLSFQTGKNGFLEGRIGAGGAGRFLLSDLEGRLPLELFRSLLAPYGVDLQGVASVSVERLETREGYLKAARGAIACSKVRTLHPQALLLGDFKLELTTEGDGVIKITIQDSGGPLAADGVILLQPDGKYTFSGSFACRDQAQPELANLLRLLGRPKEDGTVSVSLVGKVPPFA